MPVEALDGRVLGRVFLVLFGGGIEERKELALHHVVVPDIGTALVREDQIVRFFEGRSELPFLQHRRHGRADRHGAHSRRRGRGRGGRLDGRGAEQSDRTAPRK